MSHRLIEDLREVRKLLTPRGAWIQGHYMLDAEGDSPGSSREGMERAVCYCLTGAVFRQVGAYGEELGLDVSRRAEAMFVALGRGVERRRDVDEYGMLYGGSGEGSLISWNDAKGRTVREVLALVDETIRWEVANVQHSG